MGFFKCFSFFCMLSFFPFVHAQFFCRELSFAGLGRYPTKCGRKFVDTSDVFFPRLIFLVVNFHLQVSEDMRQKVVEKSLRCQGKKLEMCLHLKPCNGPENQEQKSEERNWHFFVIRSPHKMWILNKPCLQHFLRMMQKMMDIDSS